MPRNRIVRRPAARVDVVEIAVYLGTEATPEIADRFLVALDRACERLAALPQIGSPYRTTNAALRGLRKWPVPSFPNHLLFYQPVPGGVEIVRVLHASRDLIRLLEDE
jgi:toxin ParE1/3/4